MTREAKIGMLTGLGVIIVIGVLLSEYLGDPAMPLKGFGGSPNQVATGPMAPLPVSQNYRDQMTQAVAVPGMTSTVPENPIPVAYAAMTDEPVAPVQPMLPVVVAAVSPEVTQMEQVAAVDSHDLSPQTFMLADSPVPQPQGVRPAVTKPWAKSVTYTIVPGDTLAKIAKKYYSSSKNSDVQKIVNANKATLKNADTMLIAGKSLVVPDVVVAAPAPVPTTRPVGVRTTPGTARTSEGVVIYTPGGVPMPGDGHGDVHGTDSHGAASQPATPPKAKTYTVQSGDTLEKIAKKMSPSNPTAYVEKLKVANNIKDPRSLQVSQMLKLPV